MACDAPEYLVRMVRRPVPVVEVVPRTTPVIAFGDPRQAEVATLGINPSRREFIEDNLLLAGRKRRLATLESLKAESLELVTDNQVQIVVRECAAYFRADRNPYRRWFDTLDSVLRNALCVSYYNGTACHLDLVQWATDPVWGKLSARVKRQLLEESVPYLRQQLRFGNIRLVMINGRQVLDRVRRVGLARLEHCGALELRPSVRCQLYSGQGEGSRFIGWSTNLQSSFGVSHHFRNQLALWIARADDCSKQRANQEQPDVL